MPEIAVIIPSYNSSATIGRTLGSLLRQSTPAAEILVVDSSDDGKTPQVVEEIRRGAAGRGPAIKVIRLGRKTIPATGRNLGAKETAAELLAFIDSDAEAEPDWLEKIALAYADGCRAGGGAVLLPPEQRDSALAVSQYFLQFSEFMDGKERKPVRFTPSCNLFCEKKLFDEIGGFPETRAAEDVLFGKRVSDRGALFYFDPAIRVRHIFTETWQRYRSNQSMLGHYVCVCRAIESKSWIYRGILPALLMPAFMAVKCSRVWKRVASAEDKGLRAAFLKHLGTFLPGLWYYGRGFAGGPWRS